jgi:hypothetical protein
MCGSIVGIFCRWDATTAFAHVSNITAKRGLLDTQAMDSYTPSLAFCKETDDQHQLGERPGIVIYRSL